jgi:hypothetical protein
VPVGGSANAAVASNAEATTPAAIDLNSMSSPPHRKNREEKTAQATRSSVAAPDFKAAQQQRRRGKVALVRNTNGNSQPSRPEGRLFPRNAGFEKSGPVAIRSADSYELLSDASLAPLALYDDESDTGSWCGWRPLAQSERRAA